MANTNPLPRAIELAGVTLEDLAGYLHAETEQVLGWVTADNPDEIPADAKEMMCTFFSNGYLFDDDPRLTTPDDDPRLTTPDGDSGTRKKPRRKIPAAERPLYAAIRIARLPRSERELLAALLRPNTAFADSESDLVALAAAAADPRNAAWKPLDELVEAAHLDGWKLGAHVAQMKSVDAGLVYRALQLLDGNRSPERLPSGPARIETLAEAITAFGDSAAERLETVRRLAGD